MTKYCPSCGEELVDDANFCKSCGASIVDGAVRAEVPEQPLVEKSYTGFIVVGYAGAVLIPIIGILVAIYLMTRNDSEQAKKHGKYIIIVAVVVWAISFLVMFH